VKTDIGVNEFVKFMERTSLFYFSHAFFEKWAWEIILTYVASYLEYKDREISSFTFLTIPEIELLSSPQLNILQIGSSPFPFFFSSVKCIPSSKSLHNDISSWQQVLPFFHLSKHNTSLWITSFQLLITLRHWLLIMPPHSLLSLWSQSIIRSLEPLQRVYEQWTPVITTWIPLSLQLFWKMSFLSYLTHWSLLTKQRFSHYFSKEFVFSIPFHDIYTQVQKWYKQHFLFLTSMKPLRKKLWTLVFSAFDQIEFDPQKHLSMMDYIESIYLFLDETIRHSYPFMKTLGSRKDLYALFCLCLYWNHLWMDLHSLCWDTLTSNLQFAWYALYYKMCFQPFFQDSLPTFLLQNHKDVVPSFFNCRGQQVNTDSSSFLVSLGSLLKIHPTCRSLDTLSF